MKRLLVGCAAALAACGGSSGVQPAPAPTPTSTAFYCHSDLACRSDQFCRVDTGECAARLPGPALVRAVREGTASIVSWFAIPEASSYDVARAAQSGGAPEVLGTTTSIIFTDPDPPPANGRWYAVRAHFPAGTSGWSYGRLASLPSAPANLTTTSLIHGIRVSWFNGGSSQTVYTLYKARTATGPFLAIATVAASFEATRSYDDLDLGTGEEWFYEISGSSPDAATSPSAPVRGVTQGPPPAPPANVVVTLVDDGFLPAVSWSASPGAVRYLVSMNGTLLDTVTATSYTAVWNRLSTDSTAVFQVVAEGDGGDSEPASGNAVTTSPGALYGAVTATGGVSVAAVSWTDRPRAYPVAYRVLRGPAAGPFAEVGTTPDFAFTDATTGDWTTWCYEIVVDYGSGQTAPSMAACAQTRGASDRLNAGTAPVGILQQDGHTVYGQTFTARQTGQLVGLEISASNLQTAPVLRLFAGETYLASVVSQTFLGQPLIGPPGPLDPKSNGNMYVDLTGQAIFVAAGAHLRFDVPDSFQAAFRLQLGSTSGDAYPDGAATVDGTPLNDGTDLVFKTVVRPVPESLAAPAWFPALPGQDRIALAWRGVAGATSYRLGRSSDGGRTFVDLVSMAETSYVDVGLPAGTTFVYRLVAVGASGIEGAAATATPTTEGTLDAHRDGAQHLYSGQVTQRFIVGAAGLLTGIEVRVTSGPVLLEIADVAGARHGPVVVVPNLPPPDRLRPFDTVPLYVDVGSLGILVAPGDALSFSATPLPAPGASVAGIAAGDDPGGGFTIGTLLVPDRAIWFQAFVH